MRAEVPVQHEAQGVHRVRRPGHGGLARAGEVERDQAFAVAIVWQTVRRADTTVMGPRFGLQPVLGQRRDGTWSFQSTSIIENRNAIDALLRACLKAYSARSTA